MLKESFKTASKSSVSNIEDYLVPGLESDILVFINGRYQQELSSIKHNQDTLIVNDLQNISEKGREVFETFLEKL